MLPIVKRLLATIVIAWGLLALFVRSATPLADGFRPEIEAMLTNALGTPVEIESISARWYGAKPLIELQGIRFGAPGEAVDMRKAAIELAPMGWLSQIGGGDRARLLDGLTLTLEGMALTVVREPDGRFHLEGLGVLRHHTGTAPPLPRRLQLLDTRLRWIDRQLNAPSIDLTHVSIRLDREGDSLDLRARLETDNGKAETMARLNGYLGTLTWSGDSYLRVDDLDVAALLAPYLPAHYGFQSLKLNLETWTSWSEARPSSLQGNMSLRNLSLRPPAKTAGQLDIDAASAAFSLLLEDNGQMRVGLEQFRLATPDGIWPETSVALALHKAEEQWTLDFYAGYLALHDVARIALVRPVNAVVGETIAALRPRGDIEDLRLQVDSVNGVIDWQAAARFGSLGVDAWRSVPAVDGLSGTVSGQRGQALFNIDSTQARANFDGLFDEPLSFDRLHGPLSITFSDDAWSAWSEHLVADAPHLSTTNRFELRARHDEPLFLDLQTAFNDGDASAAARYYPTGIMNPALVQWLEHAIVDGRIPNGKALFHGPVADFAFEKTRSGAFEVIFDLVDAELDYQPGWPKVDELNAQLRFHGNRLDITSHSGQIYDSRIEQLTVRIPSLKPTVPVEVKARLTGPLRDKLRVLEEDALRARFGAFARGLEAQGDTRLDLDFAVKLGKRGKTALDGTLHFAKNTLGLPDWGIALSDIDGRLHFDLEGVSAEGITASGLGSRLTIDVLKRDRDITRIQAEGLLGIDAIQRQWPSLPLWFAAGEADFALAIEVPVELGAGEAQRLMSISSTLEGIAIELPAPFGKPAATRESVTLQLPLDQGPTTGSLDYGELLAARFDPNGERLAVEFGGAKPPQPTRDGIALRGEIAELDVAEWRSALSGLPEGATGELPEMAGQIRIVRVLGLPLPTAPVDVAIRQSDGTWEIGLEGSQISGQVVIPAQRHGRPVSAELTRLLLDFPLAETRAPSPPPETNAAADPAAMPGLALNILALQVNSAELGELRLVAAPTAQGWTVNQVTLGGSKETATAQARWIRGDNGTQTFLKGSHESEAFGDLLVGLGYARQVEGAPGRIEFELEWPGDPSQLHPATLQGTVDVSVRDGRLVELDPGATRIVGLFNLNALARRLRLDFSDIFRKGYSFDSIDGRFQFREATATTDDLTVTGPSGRMEIAGVTDLGQQRLDHRVRVTPKLDATLPIAGAIAGGPIAGIAVLVAQQLVADKVDEINRFEYAVNGDWADPQITQLDSGGALSKLLKPLGSQATETGTDDAPSPAVSAGADRPETEPSDEPADQAADVRSTNPLRGLLEFLKQRTIDPDVRALDQD